MFAFLLLRLNEQVYGRSRVLDDTEPVGVRACDREHKDGTSGKAFIKRKAKGKLAGGRRAGLLVALIARAC